MRNKFTVVIPTRERCSTLRHALQTCVDQQYENFEIIVSDNFSQDNTKLLVESFGDKRIRYINTGRRLSMSENFDFALNYVESGFVMFIGDDDGLFPDAIEQVNSVVNQFNVKAVLSSVSAYIWPNHGDVLRRNSFYWQAGNAVEIRKSKEWIKKFLNFESIYTFDLPGLYMGFVHLDIVKKLTKNNYFFRSITPDAYSAFACAGLLDRYAYTQNPFCIAGASARSNGASYFMQKDTSESDAFLKENAHEFHKKLRNCPSFKLIGAEAFLQFKDAFPELTANYHLDIKKLLAATLHESLSNPNPSSSKMVQKAVKEMSEINNIDFKSLSWVPTRKSKSFTEVLLRVKKSIPKLRQFISIDDARKLGVYNVCDAAKVGYALMQLNFGFKVYRHIDLLKKLLINKIKWW